MEMAKIIRNLNICERWDRVWKALRDMQARR